MRVQSMTSGSGDGVTVGDGDTVAVAAGELSVAGAVEADGRLVGDCAGDPVHATRATAAARARAAGRRIRMTSPQR
jgi:hypothetical protein